MSVLEPHPAQAALTSVVSTIVHPSPLNPQVPFCRYLADPKMSYLQQAERSIYTHAMVLLSGPLVMKSSPVDKTRSP